MSQGVLYKDDESSYSLDSLRCDRLRETRDLARLQGLDPAQSLLRLTINHDMEKYYHERFLKPAHRPIHEDTDNHEQIHHDPY